MTEKNKLSVLNQGKNTYTFEEVYDMPYVQESIKILLSRAKKNNWIVTSYEKDIKQKMLIYLNDSLPKFNPNKSNIKTFCRVVLNIGFKRAYREYSYKKNANILFATSLDNLLNNELDDIQISTIDSFHYNEHEDDTFRLAYNNLPPVIKEIANKIMEGQSYVKILSTKICSRRFLFTHALPHLREIFKKNH